MPRGVTPYGVWVGVLTLMVQGFRSPSMGRSPLWRSVGTYRDGRSPPGVPGSPL